VQEEFVEIGTRWTKGFERENATKSRYFRYIKEEADRVTRRPDLTEAQSKAVSKGLNNILSYVGGNGSRY
jgi:hypothetical protein